MNVKEENEVYLGHWKDIDLLFDITIWADKTEYCWVVHQASIQRFV